MHHFIQLKCFVHCVPKGKTTFTKLLYIETFLSLGPIGGLVSPTSLTSVNKKNYTIACNYYYYLFIVCANILRGNQPAEPGVVPTLPVCSGYDTCLTNRRSCVWALLKPYFHTCSCMSLWIKMSAKCIHLNANAIRKILMYIQTNTLKIKTQ